MARAADLAPLAKLRIVTVLSSTGMTFTTKIYIHFAIDYQKYTFTKICVFFSGPKTCVFSSRWNIMRCQVDRQAGAPATQNLSTGVTFPGLWVRAASIRCFRLGSGVGLRGCATCICPLWLHFSGAAYRIPLGMKHEAESAALIIFSRIP